MLKSFFRVYKPKNAEEQAAVPAGSFVIPVGGTAVGVKKDSGAIGTLSGGGSANTPLWTANTVYSANDEVRAAVAQGTIGAGDRIQRNSNGTSRAAFDATEAALWTELPEDPDAVLITGDQVIAGKKAFSTLPEVSADAITNNQLIRKSQHDTDLAAKISSDNIKTVNGQTIVGSGDIPLPGGQPGTVYKQYGDTDVQGNAAVDTTNTDAITQPILSVANYVLTGSAFTSAITETHRGTKWEEDSVMGTEDTMNKTSKTLSAFSPKISLGTTKNTRAAYIDSNGNQSKRSTAVNVALTSQSIAMSAGYPTASVSRTFTSAFYNLLLTNIKTNSFTVVTLGGSSIPGELAGSYVANTLNTSVANEVSCWFCRWDGSFTKGVKAKFTVSGGVISIVLTEASYWASDVMSSPSWTTSGGEPAGKNVSTIASSSGVVAYGLAALTMNFQQ